YTHPISDALEGITHSLCTLEFEDHRPLYDWVLDNITIPCHPQQIEFSRLNLNYTVTSKRKLKRLVDEGFVEGWDDPRMPTISGMRRRGFTPESIRAFCEAIGVTRSEGVVDVAMLEHAIREDLNARAPRAMGVLNPLKVVLTNYPADQREVLRVANHPQLPEMGERDVPWTQTLYIDRADFEVEAPKKWKRLALNQAVRLRGGYVISCKAVVRDAAGEISELHCEYDPATLGVNPEGYKANGVIHWVSASDAVEAEVRLYDRLFTHESPDSDKGGDFIDHLNPQSLVTLSGCQLEASLAGADASLPYQFEREGYFVLDAKASAAAGKPVFNRTVTLRDSWAKMEGKGE
ncbi:MAG: glutamine--tRNA ligase, partial [Gammaproteobacteria bacterium]|nr:glutamine--tRNA ligase [Gammaproteobacteria bacterium]